jgi:hypothetical protein
MITRSRGEFSTFGTFVPTGPYIVDLKTKEDNNEIRREIE